MSYQHRISHNGSVDNLQKIERQCTNGQKKEKKKMNERSSCSPSLRLFSAEVSGTSPSVTSSTLRLRSTASFMLIALGQQKRFFLSVLFGDVVCLG
jgi:hypothetical protein